MVDAIVLSGGEIETERFPGLAPGISRKAQIPLCSRPMVEWVVRGLRSCPQIGRIVIVGHAALQTQALREIGATVTPEAGGIAANLRAGLDAMPDAQRVLGVSGDLPLLRRAALDDLLAQAPAADLVFPYVERADILRGFPDRVWVFSETPEGAFTGGSAALFRPEALRANWPWVEDLLEARRRSPLGLARMIGPAFALKYAMRRLRVADVEAKLSALLHLTGRGYRTSFGELAMDVDKAADIPLVEQCLRQREASRLAAPRRRTEQATATSSPTTTWRSSC